jgi:hypothetical protein
MVAIKSVSVERPRASLGKRIFANEKFSLKSVALRSLKIIFVSSVILGWFPGPLSVVALSALIEAFSARKNVKPEEKI